MGLSGEGNVHPTISHEGTERERLYFFFNRGPRWGGRSTQPPGYLTPSTHCIRGWMGPSAGLNGCGKSHPTRIRSPDRPARSQSLYGLHYPGPRDHQIIKYFLLYLRWMFKRDCELPIKNNFNTVVLYYCLVLLNARCDPKVFRQLL
jgi:hypothetical protein